MEDTLKERLRKLWRDNDGNPDRAMQASYNLALSERWVRVKDRLPIEGNRYWCYVEEVTDLGKAHFQWNCYFDTDLKEFRDNHIVMKVTHWTDLLPTPPQTKD